MEFSFDIDHKLQRCCPQWVEKTPSPAGEGWGEGNTKLWAVTQSTCRYTQPFCNEGQSSSPFGKGGESMLGLMYNDERRAWER